MLRTLQFKHLDFHVTSVEVVMFLKVPFRIMSSRLEAVLVCRSGFWIAVARAWLK